MKWRKSTTNSVIVGVDKNIVYVSSTRGEHVVIFDDKEWAGFLADVKAGLFDGMFPWALEVDAR